MTPNQLSNGQAFKDALAQPWVWLAVALAAVVSLVVAIGS
jgi:hypothetical protein